MKGMALILYNNIEYAQAAVKDTKGWKIGGNKIKASGKISTFENHSLRLIPVILFICWLFLNMHSLFCLQVDFANQESQMAFYRSMQASGQDIRDFYEFLSERRFVSVFKRT